MKKESIFKGISCALITPFHADGSIDYESLEKLIEYQIQNRCQALTVCGTTGEAATLSAYEHFSLIRFAVKKAAGRIPVIAGNGSNCTAHAVELTHAACEAGCDALLTVSPYYNKGNCSGLIRSFTEIADASSKPIILYNVPSRTAVNIPLAVYGELSHHERIVGVKDAGGNIKESMALISSLSDRLDVYCGNDDILFPMLALGCSGGISVLSNIIPNEMQKICELYFSGKHSESLSLQYSLTELIDALFCDVNPIPLKYAASLLDICEGTLRLPLYETSEENKKKIYSALKKYNLIA
ncbi:MAG: 4-hydroxy-tetrahydrodipicolinate synthase [Clostridia bacterium]|nr:4-hydroxy-tetrahydrodipicolinate synthase [Clostridia bacterium]